MDPSSTLGRFSQRPTDPPITQSKEPTVEPHPERLAELETLRGEGGAFAVSLIGKTITVNLPVGYTIGINAPTREKRLRAVAMTHEYRVLAFVVDMVGDKVPFDPSCEVTVHNAPAPPPPPPGDEIMGQKLIELAELFLSAGEKTRIGRDARADHMMMMADIEQIRTMQSRGDSTPELDRRLTILLRRLNARNNEDEGGATLHPIDG